MFKQRKINRVDKSGLHRCLMKNVKLHAKRLAMALLKNKDIRAILLEKGNLTFTASVERSPNIWFVKSN